MAESAPTEDQVIVDAFLRERQGIVDGTVTVRACFWRGVLNAVHVTRELPHYQRRKEPK